ncbi:MAG TPA: GNAT family N-acetyltransferase [Candidatus Limnocylindria bacterium]
MSGLASLPAEAAAIAEGILYDYDVGYVPPDLEIVERDDVLMWTRPSPTKWSSSVRVAKWSTDEAARRIDEVIAFFAARRRPFVWHVGPSSRPEDLAERLRTRGFHDTDPTRLLIAGLPIRGLRAGDVRIVEARERVRIREYLRFGHPDWTDEQVESEIGERQLFIDRYGERGGFLLAYMDGASVANAAWRDSTDGRAVYLTGAGTLPEHRRKGIYQTLVAYRTDRAISRGCRYAVIQAQVDTSMPILLRRGFVDVGPVNVLSSE